MLIIIIIIIITTTTTIILFEVLTLGILPRVKIIILKYIYSTINLPVQHILHSRGIMLGSNADITQT